MLLFVRQGGEELEDAKHSLMDRLMREVPDERVIQAMKRVPREAFVPEVSRDKAYEDIPVPIGEGQTISQPYIVALMLQALELRRSDKVLEVGTGSGYQAAILAEIACEVIAVERIRTLADSARRRLTSLGYTNVKVVLAEKGLGWEREAPYDAIIVAAGAPKLPRELMDQMGNGGRLVIPVGSQENQELMKVSRSEESFSVERLVSCRFVPLVGEGAWPETAAGERGTAPSAGV
jgi:protein-L-isoaspartate(D-aspartate) O-methyltransferase